MELSKMFLNQINYWQLETPLQRRQRVPNDDAAGYKANYTRYQAVLPEPVNILPTCFHALCINRTVLLLQMAVLLQCASVL